MKLFASGAICRVAAISLFLASCAIPPSLHAQAKPIQGIVQLNVDGAYLGIEMEDVTASNMATYKLSSERGVIVRSVAKGSPAETAKLQENDVILDFAGFPVWSSIQLRRLVQETPSGRKADLVVSRDGKKLNLTAELRRREGSMRSDNKMEIVPRDRNGREFRFFGPDGRSFQFQIPDGGLFEFGPLPGSGPAESSRRGRLGVTLQPLTDQLAKYFGVPGNKGALVTSTAADSPAAGRLQAGDVIIRAGDKSIDSPGDLTQFIRERADGKLDLRVIRDKREITVTVDLPPDGSKGYKL